MGQTSCKCGAGSIRLADGTCAACVEEASTCPGFEQDAAMLSRSMFMALPKESGTQAGADGIQRFVEIPRAFACQSTESCPGGQTPGQCPTGYSGVACADCVDGYQKSNGKCEKCGDKTADRVVGVFVVLGMAVGGSFGVVKVVSQPRKRYITTAFSMATTLGVFVTFMQLTSLMVGMTIEWPSAFLWLLNVLTVLNLDLGFLGLDCTLGSSYAVPLIVKPVLAFLVAGLMAIAWCLGHALPSRRCLSKVLADRPSPFVLMNSCGFLSNILFVPIAMQAFSIFVCYDHPNGGSSMLSMPGVLCYEGSWNSQVVPAGLISMVLMLAIYVTLLVLCLRAPSIPKSYQRLTFLLARFRPEAYYWNSCILTRNLLLSCCPSLTTNAFLVVLLMNVVCMVYGAALVKLSPWRFPLHNSADMVTVYALMLTLLAGVVFSQTPSFHYSPDQDAPAWKVLQVATLLPLVVAVLALGVVFVHGYLTSKGDKHTEQMQELVGELETVSQRLQKLCGSDGKMPDSTRTVILQNGSNLSLYDLRQLHGSCALIADLLLGDSSGSTKGSSSRKSSRRVMNMDVKKLEAAPSQVNPGGTTAVHAEV